MRIVAEWEGGASVTQSHYRVVCDDDADATRYEIQILAGSEYRELSRFEHLKAQQIAVHIILDDKERVERRVIRDEFMRRLKRA